MDCFHERIFYYWRHGYYGHVQYLCQNALKKNYNDLFLQIWYSLASGILGQTEEALNGVSKIKYRSDLTLLLIICQICINESSPNKNIDIITKLYNSINEYASNSNHFCLTQSIQVAIMFQNFKLAMIIQKYQKEQSSIEGWLKLFVNEFKKANKIFDTVLKHKKDDLFAYYGKYILYLATNQKSNSLDIYGEITRLYNFPEINIEKARYASQNGKWDQALIILDELKQSFPTTIEIEIFSALNSLTRNQNIEKASDSLFRIYEICEIHEKFNWKLTAKLSQAFGYLACENKEILNQTIQLAQLGYDAMPTQKECCEILAYHQIILGDFISVDQILNKIDCSVNIQMIYNYGLKEYKQLEDKLDLFENMENNLYTLTYRSLLARQQQIDSSHLLEQMIESIQATLKDIQYEKSLEFDYEKYLDVIIQLKLDILFIALNEIIVSNESIRFDLNDKFNDIETIISNLFNFLPGFIPLIFLRAVLLFKRHRYSESLYLFEKVLISNWNYRVSEILVYMSQINYLNHNIDLAKENIDEALTLDSNLANDLNFQIIRTEIYHDASNLPFLFAIFEQNNYNLTLLLKFLDLLITFDNFDSARSLLLKRLPKIEHSMEKSQIILRQAKVFAGYDHFDRAFLLLSKLKSHSKFRNNAILTEIEIKSKYKLKGLSDSLRQLENQEQAGDFYYNLSNFELASKCYHNSIESSNIFPDLFLKYFRSLIKSHQFGTLFNSNRKWINTFKEHSFVILFLLKEFIKIREYSESKFCIETAESFVHNSNLIIESDFYHQSGFVYWKLNDYEKADAYFKKAKQIYLGINSNNKKIKSDASRFFNTYANFCLLTEKEKSVNSYYLKSIEFDSRNSEPIFNLISYYKSRYDHEKCIELCTNYLNKYPDDYKMALELTNFETTDYSLYIDTLIHVLDLHPNFHRILVRLIEICSEAGKLDRVEKRITKDKSPGMIFCDALYSMCCGNWTKAMNLFQIVQNDAKWGANAKIKMFMIIINPNKNFIWYTNQPLSNETNLQKAEEIIDDLAVLFEKEPFFIIEKELMKAEIEISRNSLNSISKAESLFNSIIEKFKQMKDENEILEIQLIASLVGYAKCMLKKENIKQANIYIDKVLQFKPSHETNSFFEETYLMRAEIFKNEKNFEAAHHFAFFALSKNMSSRRAWEMCAEISRQNLMYAEAANAYWHCWKLSGETDLDSAYNYAFCSMKANRPEDAMEMCRLIHDKRLNYKNLKETILIPAYLQLKP